MHRSLSRLVARLGFIGLGQMGGRMAPHAAKLGIEELSVYDSNDAAVSALAARLQGTCRVVACESPARVAESADRVITMLPHPDAVKQVYGGDAGLLSGASKGALFIDCSTVDAATSRAVAALANERGCVFADAPVSGGILAAAGHALVFMVGASDQTAFERTRQVLEPFGKAVVHAGGVGCGSVCKLCNNMLLGQHMLAASEAMLLGTRLGVDAEVLQGIVSSSSGSCWSMVQYNPFPGVCPDVPASHEYQGGFESRLMLKDLNLAIDAAKEVGLITDGAATAQKAYANLVSDGASAQRDFAAMLPYLDKKSPKP